MPGGTLPAGLWTLPASGEGNPERYTDSRGNGDIGLFSPDGRWVVFDADEGKGSRTFLTRYPDTGGRWQLAEESAVYSRFARGGREIVYLAADAAQATALPVDLSGVAPRFGAPQRLFPVPMPSIKASRYSAAQSGQRMRAKPRSKMPQSRYRATTPSRRPRQKPYRRSKRSSQAPSRLVEGLEQRVEGRLGGPARPTCGCLHGRRPWRISCRRPGNRARGSGAEASARVGDATRGRGDRMT
jgi:hypothetical protein